MKTFWKFEALDTLFFRDSHPMNVGETVWLQSQFPPTGRTLQGAVRTAVLNHLGVNFYDFLNDPEQQQLREEIGNGDSFGRLELTGPILMKEGTLLFPVPFDLMRKNINDGKDQFSLLRPADTATFSDLGRIRFPILPEGEFGFKPVTGVFVDREGLETLLKGQVDANLASHLFLLCSGDRKDEALTHREPKIGLARDNQKRLAEEGKLYAIAPVRPIDCLKIAIQIDGLHKDHYPKKTFIQRLGGEGRMAGVSVEDEGWTYPKADVHKADDHIRFKLVFCTSAYMPEGGWLPEGAVRVDNTDGATSWSITTPQGSFEVISACIGKPFKQGGWNHALAYPRELCSYIPAGSVYFCQADLSEETNILRLHGQKLGCQTEYGFGQILVGCW